MLISYAIISTNVYIFTLHEILHLAAPPLKPLYPPAEITVVLVVVAVVVVLVDLLLDEGLVLLNLHSRDQMLFHIPGTSFLILVHCKDFLSLTD